MRKSPAIFLSLLAPLIEALPTKVASSALSAPAQANCADDNMSKGEGKFTGQMSGGPDGSFIEVTSGV